MRKFSLLLVLLSLLACKEQEKLNQYRNIVIILADDHALKVSGYQGNELVKTPSIDRLASEGISFSNTYCNSPICSASRQSLLTGKYPHATGVNLLFTPFPDEGNITIAEHLREKGYETAIIGKTHWNNWVWAGIFEDGMPDHGFNTILESSDYMEFYQRSKHPPLPDSLEYYSSSGLDPDLNTAEWMNCRVLPQPVCDSLSMGTWFTHQAIEFISENREQPFLLWLAYKEPHHPYYFPVEFAGRYQAENMPLPGGSPEDDRYVPERFRNLSNDEKKGIIASYYTSTEYLDKNIGLFTEALDSLGLAENTILVYISDNGYLLNDHKRFEKHTMWEEACHQPLIIRAGKSFRAGEKEEALIEYADLVPTLMNLTNKAPLPGIQGRDFSSVIYNQSEDHRDYVFSEYLVDNMAMLANKEWKYIYSTGSRDLGIGYQTGHGPIGMQHRLYNLISDPGESHDVSAKHPEILLKMKEAMLERFLDSHPDAASCPAELSLEGKLAWFCEPRDIGDDQGSEEKPKRIFPAK